jgi:hypothetical protein
MAKMNGKAIAQFFIDKGERVGLGLAGVIALVAVGGMTDWSGFDKSPSQLTDGATKAQSALVGSAWPETETQAYPIVSLTKLTNDAVVKPLEVSWFDYSTPMSPKIYPKTKALEEPPFLPVESLLADSGTFVMETFPPELEGTEATPEGDAEAKDPAAPAVDPARQRRDGAAGAGAAGGALAGAPAAPGGAAAAAMHGSMSSSSGPAAAMPPAGMHGGAEMMMAGMTGGASGRSGKGVRYVVVRGVIPFRTQLEKLARSLNLNTTAEAMQYLQYDDFEIERQRAVRGPAPWAEGDDAWEKVDQQVAVDLLTKEAANWDLEVVQTEVTDATFTMPLPARLVGFWTADEVSHPRLEAWRLKEEEKIKEAEKNAKLLESASEKGIGGRGKGSGGFKGIQPDINTLRGSMPMDGMMPGMAMPGMTPPGMAMPGMHGSGMHGGGSSSGMPRPGMARPGMAQPGMAQPGMAPPGMAMPGMHGSAMAMPGAGGFGMAGADIRTPMVVLFRYFDTVVEPGAAYRYRVRLKALNPNFGLSLDQVANPSVVEGEFRWTDWSEPSNPVIVPADTVYATAKVPRKSGRPESAADLTIFQWNSERGTLVTDTIKSVYGQLVGGKKKTKVLDVAKPSLSDEEIAIRGSDILVDSLGVAGLTSVASTTGASPTLKAAFDDLRIDKNQWVKLLDSGSLDLSVTVNPAGELVINDNAMLASEMKRMEAEVKLEREPWKDLENAPAAGAPGATGLDAYMEAVAGAGHGAGMHGGGDPKDKKKKKGKAYNPARMGAMGSSEMGMMPGMAMPGMSMPGMAMPGMSTPGGKAKKGK